MALPLVCPKDCLYKLVPFKLGNPPEAVEVTVNGCGGLEEVNTEVKVVELEFWEPAAACSKEASCSGLYSLFIDLLAVPFPVSVTEDMLGKREDIEVAEVA